MILGQFQRRRTVAAVSDGDVDSFIFQAAADPHKPLELFMRKGLVLLIGHSKMSEYPPDFDARQGGNFLDDGNAFLIGQESDTAHTGINGNMNLQGLAQAGRFR